MTEKFHQWSSQDRDLFWGLHPNSHPWAAIYVGQEPQRQKLCQGKKVGSVISRCSWLHRYDPYLLLGPFKYEEIRRNPWVGILRQIATMFELGKVMEEAREAALVPTSLVHFRGGAYTEDVAGTLRRTSKVTYRSEAVLPPLAAWTQRLELATGLSIAQHRMDSENYQIMNYGLGGAILTHRDTDNLNLDDDSFSESWRQGGPRLATIMIWLKTVNDHLSLLWVWLCRNKLCSAYDPESFCHSQTHFLYHLSTSSFSLPRFYGIFFCTEMVQASQLIVERILFSFLTLVT